MRPMREIARCLSPASKARPKRSSGSGTRRFIAAAATAWRNLPGARCLGGALSLTNLTMLVSGTLCWAVVVPVLQTKGVIASAGFAAIVQWTLWFGASCMVAAGLLSFALSWRTALRAFRDLGQMLSFRSAPASEPGRIEAPMSWFAVGQIVSLVALAWLGHASFGMPVWQSVIAVALSFLLALVACRVTGETDTTPVGAMGKVTQLTFGALSPGNVNVNLMSANITAGAATSAADLLTDL